MNQVTVLDFKISVLHGYVGMCTGGWEKYT